MAIPGLEPDLQIKGKVRNGIKQRSRTSGKEFPVSVDYFVSDDPEFTKAFGEKPKSLVISPALFDPEKFFDTGLEWWTKAGSRNDLACFTKGEMLGGKPLALRKEYALDVVDGEIKNDVLGELRTSGRMPIACPARQCPHLKEKRCKPMGRLYFYACPEATRDRLGPYQLDTKGWNSIEALTGFLQGRTLSESDHFRLEVRFEVQGSNKFPLLSLKEMPNVDVNTEADVNIAEAVIALANSDPTRENLAAFLDLTRPGWKQDAVYVAEIKTQGVERHIKAILAENA